MRFQVVIMQPPGYRHSGAFTETAETLVHGFRALGHQSMLTVNAVSSEAVNVVLGMHLLPLAAIQQLPPQTVMYNLEQVEEGLFGHATHLREAFGRFEVWDYSRRNIETLATMGLASDRLYHLPIGTTPEMTRIVPAPEQDIDVLFYGVVNEHRRLILKAIQDAGLTVKVQFGCYGATRDALIARAKLVVNLHKHEAQVFEIVRVSYLLANHKAVVAEITPRTEVDPDIRDAVAGASPADMPALCRHLVDDQAARAALEARGFAIMSARRQPDYLEILLAERTRKMKKDRHR